MASSASNLKNLKFKRTLEIGDMAFWIILRNTPFLNSLIFNTEKAIFEGLQFLAKLNMGLMAFPQTTILRYNKGKLQGGIVPVLLTAFVLVNINATETHHLLSGFGIFITPYILFTSNQSELYDFLFVNIHSIPLLVFTCVFTLIGIGQSLHIYLFEDGLKSATSRGTSRFWLFLSWVSKPKRGKARTFHPSKFGCEFVFETVIMAALGIVSWHYLDDKVFAIVCFSAAIAEAIQTLDDASRQQAMDKLLNA